MNVKYKKPFRDNYKKPTTAENADIHADTRRPRSHGTNKDAGYRLPIGAMSTRKDVGNTLNARNKKYTSGDI